MRLLEKPHLSKRLAMVVGVTRSQATAMKCMLSRKLIRRSSSYFLSISANSQHTRRSFKGCLTFLYDSRVKLLQVRRRVHRTKDQVDVSEHHLPWVGCELVKNKNNLQIFAGHPSVQEWQKCMPFCLCDRRMANVSGTRNTEALEIC